MEKADWDGVAELCEVAFRHIGEDWHRHVNPLVDYHGAQISEWVAWVQPNGAASLAVSPPA